MQLRKNLRTRFTANDAVSLPFPKGSFHEGLSVFHQVVLRSEVWAILRRCRKSEKFGAPSSHTYPCVAAQSFYSKGDGLGSRAICSGRSGRVVLRSRHTVTVLHKNSFARMLLKLHRWPLSMPQWDMRS